MAVLTGSLLFTGTTTATAASLGFLKVAVGGLVFSAATSAVTNALIPKPDISALGANGTQTNFRSPNSPHDIVYGETRKGGAITFMESTDSNKYLHMIVVLAGHEIDSVQSVYINDRVATINGTGFVTSTIDGGTDTWNSKIRIFAHTGAHTKDTVFANIGGSTNTGSKTLGNTLQTESDVVDATFVGSGLSYLYIRLEYDAEVFNGGIPTFTAKIKGKKVYDPRKDSTSSAYDSSLGTSSHRAATASTWEWSANAALCIRDYLTSDYGVNSPTSEINDDSFGAAADACATVSVGSDPVNPFDINGVVQTSSTPQSILNTMITACGGTLFWGQGYWKLMVGYQTARSTALTIDDLRSGLNLDTRMSRRDAFNTVQGQFADAAQDYILVDYPEYQNSAALTEDNSQESILDLPLPLTSSSATAQRLAKQALLRNREQMTFTASFGIKAFDIQAGDTVKLTLARYGWTNKEFEVVGWNFTVGDNVGVNLTLRETSSAAFSWVENDYSVITGNNTNLPSPFSVGTPRMQLPTDVTVVGGGGFATTKIRFSWLVAYSGTITNRYEFAWKLSTDTNYTSILTNELFHEVSPVKKGDIYNFKVRAVNNLGITSDYDIYGSNAYTVASQDTLAPSAPVNATGTGLYQSAIIRWTLPTTNSDGTPLTDLSHFSIYRYTSSQTPQEGGKIADVRGTEFIDEGLGNLASRYYYVKSIDLTGNRSAPSAEVYINTLRKPDVMAGQSPIPYGFQIEFTGDPSTTTPTSGSPAIQSLFNDATVAAVASQISGFSTINLQEMPDDAIYVVKFVSNNTNDSDGNPKVSIRTYNPANNQWSAHADVTPNDIAVDGSIIATGSITADQISANYARLIEIDADQITTGLIQADQLQIKENLQFEDGGAYYSGMTAYNDGSGIFIGNPSGTEHDYAFGFSTGSGSSKKALNMNASEFSLYNPTIYSGASTATSANAGSGTITIPTGAVQMTVTLIGGGGGGGGSESDRSDNNYSPAKGREGTPTIASFTAAGVNSGNAVYLTAAGGAGGANGSNIASGGVGAGGSTTYGTGGAVGASQANGTSAAATAYGAGGGGGGSRPYGGWLNSGQDSTTQGQGGLAGANVSNTYDVSGAGEFDVTIKAGVGGANTNGVTVHRTVTVQSVSGSNKYFIDYVQQDTLELQEGNTYRFDVSDSSNSSHPFRFSTTSNGSHGGGSQYTTGVTTSGTQGQANAYVQIVVAASAPTLYYYCTAHGGMGGTANTPAAYYGNGNVTDGGAGADGRVYVSYLTNAAALVDLEELTEAKVLALQNGSLGTTYTSYNSTDRANNTWYQNTSGKPMVVTINSTGGGYKAYVNTSASTTGAMLMIDFGNGTGQYEKASVTFVVPNNSYYYGGRHTNADSSWVELT
tara:strand:- start:16562 stop:20722 length:4161 start_codon:yes stop_codon:yes gene_type:complete